MDAEGGLGPIFQEAAKIKSAQLADKRRTYDKWPYFLQHTLFHGEKEDIRTKRELPFPERLAAAADIKLEGNEMFSKQKYVDAIEVYERAAGLLYYALSTDPEWRNNKRGIDDDILVLKDCIVDDALSGDAKRDVVALRVSCYLNIAAGKLKLRQFQEAKIACNSVLELDAENVKALYRRAQALVTPIGAGGLEMELAIADLQTAAHIEPQHVEVRTLLSRLKQERAVQRGKDRAQYDGLFDRGEMYSSPPPKGSNDNDAEVLEKYKSRISTMQDSDGLEQRIQDALMLRDLYRRNGKGEEAEKLHQQIVEARKALKDGGKKNVDFGKPDNQMIQDAKEYGLDLTDPAVQEELARLEQKRASGVSLDTNGKLPVGRKSKHSSFSWKVFFGVLAVLGGYRFLNLVWPQEDEF
eukprot:GEMP01025960.1.p1 GENE.GEMP01025960.1~~GEMP01025960.1.p1  ORF type:complete len:411 (+),score=93.15 GEMP01025960.1:227-1459(+)